LRILGLHLGQGGHRALLWTMVGLLVAKPLIQSFGTQPLLFPLFFTGVMLASVWAVCSKPRQLIGISILALVSITGEWLLLAGKNDYHIVIVLVELIAFTWIAAVLAEDVFCEQKSINADTIYGGINVYLMITIAFSAAYKAQILLFPDSIHGLTAESTMSDTLYFSAVTMTTLGFGDIAPISENARMLTYMQAMIGQFYIAILMAKLVATYIASTIRNSE
jgi:voltage-gated potassium channel